MFSGIVETLGRIVDLKTQEDCQQFYIFPNRAWCDLVLGESISVNGVCLTVENFDQKGFYVRAVPETLHLTNLSFLKIGDLVNLERSLLASSRLGGHFVQGHVESLGEIMEIWQEGAAWRVHIRFPKILRKYIVQKGFISLDGMSITLVDIFKDIFTVVFVPHTIKNTLVQYYHVGSLVNLETDMLAKYIENFLGEVYE